EKGAFTHATHMKPGRFDLAGSGTLFFDEVSEMSLATQMKLLRVLQEREFMRVGGTRLIRTNARIVAATARDLRSEVKAGRFRDDLFYRISVVPITLPPLRERPTDIPLLADYFLRQLRIARNAQTEGFAPETLDILVRYSWPGNIRELRNVVERMLVLHGRKRLLTPDCLPEEIRKPEPSGVPHVGRVNLEEAVNTYERRLIEEALRAANGVQTRAAELLGTTRRILRYRMQKLNIPGKPDESSPSAG
ncbi:MAG: sigma 54-interacting transcriptional regulator, partial [Kiritimatiellae bacterium]|nr:sigma 54-interacting transcriptional regulator [Kiritimatiellia bacterium]